MNYTIDATGKTIGRTASQVAKLLMGKDQASFEKNTITKNKVNLTNVSKSKIDVKKLTEKIYTSYSGYPGGQKNVKMGKMIEKSGHSEVFKKAIYGMLPANKLRDQIMKNLTISE